MRCEERLYTEHSESSRRPPPRDAGGVHARTDGAGSCGGRYQKSYAVWGSPEWPANVAQPHGVRAHRGIHFVSRLLEEILNSDDSITTCGRTAYNETLAQHHGRVVKFMVRRLLSLLPTRKGFFETVSLAGRPDQVPDDIFAFYGEFQPVFQAVWQQMDSLGWRH